MSLITSFRTGVTGMSVQSRRVRSVSGDIANAKTVGYKNRTSEFAALVNTGRSGGTLFGNNGDLSVAVKDRITPQKQGPLRQTSSRLDVALNGNGFFLVKNASGTLGCLRTGSFSEKNGGWISNDQGFVLQGWKFEGDTTQPGGTTKVVKVPQVLETAQDVRVGSLTEGITWVNSETVDVRIPILEADSSVQGEYDFHLSETIESEGEEAAAILPRTLIDSRGGVHEITVSCSAALKGSLVGGVLLDVQGVGGMPSWHNHAFILYDAAGNPTAFFDGWEETEDNINNVNNPNRVSLNGNKVIFSDTSWGEGTITFDLSDFKVMRSNNPSSREITNGDTVEWSLPMSLTENGDFYIRRMLFNMAGTSVGVELTILKNEAGYMGQVTSYDGGMNNMFSANLIMDSEGGVQGYTVQSDRFDPETNDKSYQSSILTMPVGRSKKLPEDEYEQVGTFSLDLGNVEIKDAMTEQITIDTYVNIPGAEYVITEDGILGMLLENDQIDPLYRLALATCNAPDQMRENSGGFYSPTNASGALRAGVSGADGFGTVVPATLEESTVDIAEELTETLKAQYAHVANSKVCMTVSEMLDALMRL